MFLGLLSWCFRGMVHSPLLAHDSLCVNGQQFSLRSSQLLFSATDLAVFAIAVLCYSPCGVCTLLLASQAFASHTAQTTSTSVFVLSAFTSTATSLSSFALIATSPFAFRVNC